MMIIIWLIILLGVGGGVRLRGGRQIPMPPPHLKPTINQSTKKEIVHYHLSMGQEISETELNDTINKKP